jgi:hypothetical protein
MKLALFAGILCVALTGVAHSQSRNDPETMITLWTQANSQCRGGSGDNPATKAACTERDGYKRRLDQLNWCYGKKGQAGFEMRWHRCDADSRR